MNDLVLGITGASGAVYAARLLDILLAAGRNVHVSISPAGQAVLRHELNVDLDLRNVRPDELVERLNAAAAEIGGWKPADVVEPRARPRGELRYHHYQDFMAPIASGSALTAGMVICPCSGGTLSAIAHGGSDNLIQRAADVHLKERRRLVLVPRETPLSAIQLDNMKRCAEAGAVVLPAMPGYYHQPRSIGDLVDFVVARVCDQLGVEQRLMKRWGEK
jgi:4-hydroxy-3-polyprenylbenzoate decarboxylase